MEETKVQETTEGGQEPQNQQQTAAAGAQPGQEPAAEQFDAEYVRKLRAEAAEYRKRLRELEQKAQEQENAKLSETERLQKRLAELERQKREAELDAIRGVQHSVGFGSQIRSYVMQPYQMVKDLRSEHEVGNVDAVFDGALDDFMEAYLRWQRAEALAEG